jgi:hypothetical protein
MKDIYERSYLDILNELAVQINSDTCIPKEDKKEINKATNKLFELLWKYSN